LNIKRKNKKLKFCFSPRNFSLNSKKQLQKNILSIQSQNKEAIYSGKLHLEAGLSQREIAHILGVSQSTINWVISKELQRKKAK